ncbi:hypothetical protein Hdeb2414_s0012g00387611 [Helianthus debilis subsp. tardiflorus]
MFIFPQLLVSYPNPATKKITDQGINHRKTAVYNSRDGTAGDRVPPATPEDCRRQPKRRDTGHPVVVAGDSDDGDKHTHLIRERERERERRVGGGDTSMDGRRRWFADRSRGGGGSKLRQPVFGSRLVHMLIRLMYMFQVFVSGQQ